MQICLCVWFCVCSLSVYALFSFFFFFFRVENLMLWCFAWLKTSYKGLLAPLCDEKSLFGV